jgi:hypothetical protein
MEYVVDKVTLGPILIRVFDASIIPQMLSTHLQGCSSKGPHTIIMIISLLLLLRSRYSDGVRAGRPGFDFRQCKIFLFSTASRLALGSTQSPTQWVPGTLPPRVKLTTHLHLVARSR